MARPVQADHRHVAHFPFQGFGHPGQVFLDRSVNVDTALGPGSDGNFFHIHVRRVEQASLRGDGNHGNGAALSLGDKVGPFDGIDGNIHFIPAGPDLFPDIQHRGFVQFAFADDNRPVDVDRVKHAAHGVDSQLIRAVLIPAPDAAGCGDSRLFRDPYEFHGKFPFHACQTTFLFAVFASNPFLPAQEGTESLISL